MSKMPVLLLCRGRRARGVAGQRAYHAGKSAGDDRRAYKAVFVVPHGCAGSATIKIRVQIPEGVIAAKPMPKPGWNVETIKGKYAGEL